MFYTYSILIIEASIVVRWSWALKCVNLRELTHDCICDGQHWALRYARYVEDLSDVHRHFPTTFTPWTCLLVHVAWTHAVRQFDSSSCQTHSCEHSPVRRNYDVAAIELLAIQFLAVDWPLSSVKEGRFVSFLLIQVFIDGRRWISNWVTRTTDQTKYIYRFNGCSPYSK